MRFATGGVVAAEQKHSTTTTTTTTTTRQKAKTTFTFGLATDDETRGGKDGAAAAIVWIDAIYRRFRGGWVSGRSYRRWVHQGRGGFIHHGVHIAVDCVNRREERD